MNTPYRVAGNYGNAYAYTTEASVRNPSTTHSRAQITGDSELVNTALSTAHMLREFWTSEQIDDTTRRGAQRFHFSPAGDSNAQPTEPISPRVSIEQIVAEFMPSQSSSNTPCASLTPSQQAAAGTLASLSKTTKQVHPQSVSNSATASEANRATRKRPISKASKPKKKKANVSVAPEDTLKATPIQAVSIKNAAATYEDYKNVALNLKEQTKTVPSQKKIEELIKSKKLKIRSENRGVFYQQFIDDLSKRFIKYPKVEDYQEAALTYRRFYPGKLPATQTTLEKSLKSLGFSIPSPEQSTKLYQSLPKELINIPKRVTYEVFETMAQELKANHPEQKAPTKTTIITNLSNRGYTFTAGDKKTLFEQLPPSLKANRKQTATFNDLLTTTQELKANHPQKKAPTKAEIRKAIAAKNLLIKEEERVLLFNQLPRDLVWAKKQLTYESLKTIVSEFQGKITKRAVQAEVRKRGYSVRPKQFDIYYSKIFTAAEASSATLNLTD